MKIDTGIISATIGLTSDKIEITNPSLDTIILNLWLGLRERITDWRRAQLTHAALREEDIKQRLAWSIRQDLDDEADDLRAVISDCNTAKAQAESRLTSILNYLDPNEFYSTDKVPGWCDGCNPGNCQGCGPDYTQHPQVPEAQAAAPAVQGINEDDAPEGYKAVPWSSCRACECEESTVRCPRRAGDEDGDLHCVPDNRPDRTEVMFVKRA